MIFHGTADRNVPFNGGGRRDVNDGRPYPSVSYAVDVLRKAGKLPEMRETVKSSGRFACESTGEGARDAEVTLCKVQGGKHSWPAGANTMLWDFFAAHTRT
jgi:polyhydroxybutyrate depolymerase